jgi:hypothetical protein
VVGLSGLRAQLGGQRAPHVFVAADGVVVGRREVGLEAGRVRQEVVQRDGRFVGGNGGNVAGQGVLDVQLAVHLQTQDRGGRELLGDRADRVDDIGRHRQPALAVGEAVALAQQDLAAAGHEHRAGVAGRGEPGVGLAADLARDDNGRGLREGGAVRERGEQHEFREATRESREHGHLIRGVRAPRPADERARPVPARNGACRAEGVLDSRPVWGRAAPNGSTGEYSCPRNGGWENVPC